MTVEIGPQLVEVINVLLILLFFWIVLGQK